MVNFVIFKTFFNVYQQQFILSYSPVSVYNEEGAMHRLRLFINDNKCSCHFIGGEKLTSHNVFISTIFSVLKQWQSNKKHTVTFSSPKEEFYGIVIGLSTMIRLFTISPGLKLCHRSLIGKTIKLEKILPQF